MSHSIFLKKLRAQCQKYATNKIRAWDAQSKSIVEPVHSLLASLKTKSLKLSARLLYLIFYSFLYTVPNESYKKRLGAVTDMIIVTKLGSCDKAGL